MGLGISRQVPELYPWVEPKHDCVVLLYIRVLCLYCTSCHSMELKKASERGREEGREGE